MDNLAVRFWFKVDYCFSIMSYDGLVEKELLTPPEHMSSLPVCSGVHITRSLILCVCFVDLCLSFFSLAIVLSILLPFTDSDYSFGIFKFVLHAI